MGTPLNPRAEVDTHDFLNLDSLLDEEERAIQGSVRRFVQDRVLPDIGDWYDRGVFPRELAHEMGDLGLLGMHLDGYGCAGTDAVSYGLACRELEAGDSGFRSFVSVQGSLAMFPIHAFGSEDHKQEWLPRLASGEAVGCFGLTEADSGSDPSSMRTNAKRDSGGDWILNGSKMWITNGGIADVAVVWAMTDDGIRGFVVPTDTPGFQANDVHQKLSLRASVTSELVFEDLRLPESAVLPEVTGLRGPLSCLNEARFGILFGVTGAARACYEAALDYSLSREQFGKPIAGYQLVQRKLVEMMVSVNQTSLVALHLGRLKDAGKLAPAQVSFGKMNNTSQAIAVARESRNCLGANGITLEYAPIRHMTNLEAVYTYEGTHEIHTLAMGHAITKLAAYR